MRAVALLASAASVQGLFLKQTDPGSAMGSYPGSAMGSYPGSAMGSYPGSAMASYPVATAVTTPLGVVDDAEDPLDSSTTVVCDDPDVPVSTKQLFSVMMSCNRKEGHEMDALCTPYGMGGCDNEVCHDLCNKMYHSSNTYEKCRCKSWGESKKFKHFSAGAPCPLKVQPRCYGPNLYRSECEALMANEGISAADTVVVAQSAWPKDELNISVKENAPECAP